MTATSTAAATICFALAYVTVVSLAHNHHNDFDAEAQCSAFQTLEFLHSYDETQALDLGAHYLGDEAFDVVYAQRGSCSGYKDCFLAETTTTSTCKTFEAISTCMGRKGRPSLVFDRCFGNRCEFVMPPDATRCFFEKWRGVDASRKAPGSCLPIIKDRLFEPRPMSVLRSVNGNHCLLPVPSDSKIMKQIECREPGNEPWFRWWYEFSEPLSDQPYSCLLLSKCKSVDDPLDFVCISGEGAQKKLNKIASTNPPMARLENVAGRMPVSGLLEKKNLELQKRK
ncbi:hypothetical protein BSKO_11053 [Bryopsis sp. KO-2023]|nr:hypothetical protein BSKO_11053 [Bryopsis sp. KO-2023]